MTGSETAIIALHGGAQPLGYIIGGLILAVVVAFVVGIAVATKPSGRGSNAPGGGG